jgi:hypothetical protein
VVPGSDGNSELSMMVPASKKWMESKMKEMILAFEEPVPIILTPPIAESSFRTVFQQVSLPCVR